MGGTVRDQTSRHIRDQFCLTGGEPEGISLRREGMRKDRIGPAALLRWLRPLLAGGALALLGAGQTSVFAATVPTGAPGALPATAPVTLPPAKPVTLPTASPVTVAPPIT